MRIAILSTCAVSVPPRAYGGTELVTGELAKMLSRRGHDVTVYATGDSAPEATLRYCFAKPVWPPDPFAELRHAAFAWRDMVRQDPPFDIVHAHQAPSIAFSAVPRSGPRLPVVLTLHHHRIESLVEYYRDFSHVAYVAISKRQAALLPELDISDVVYHGVDPDLYPEGTGGGGYAAFLGRLAREKAPHLAVDAAALAGVRLAIGGVPHPPDLGYFAETMEPRLAGAGDRVDLRGEVDHAKKLDLLRNACALLFPIQWEEPFGLVMIESMLVGTPVVAMPRGSVPEVVEEGITGFVVRNTAEMASRLREIGSFDRRRCRRRAIERWSSLRMTTEYEAVYERLVDEGEWEPLSAHAGVRRREVPALASTADGNGA
jgi:glycosyltransferase involved in cell wall biosynthesis